MKPLETMRSNQNFLVVLAVVIGAAGSLTFGLVMRPFLSQPGIAIRIVSAVFIIAPVIMLTIFALVSVGVKEYKFYEDRVVQSGLMSTREVAYDDVLLTVRHEGIMDGFKLVQEDGEGFTLGWPADPDRAEELLRSYLPSTADVLERGGLSKDDSGNADTALGVLLGKYAEDYQDDMNAPPLLDPDTFEELTGFAAMRIDVSELAKVGVPSNPNLNTLVSKAKKKRSSGTSGTSTIGAHGVGE